MEIPFIKMDGTGNDFVILDARERGATLSPGMVRDLAARNHPKTRGCDQLIVLETSDSADVFMRIYNADGGEVSACGNATRCVGALLVEEKSREEVQIHTAATQEGEPLIARQAKEGIEVDMGVPKLTWQAIPLSEDMDTLHVPVTAGPLSDAVAVSMGNPHVVFFVDDAEAVDLAALAPEIQASSLFPEGVNVGVVTLTDKNKMRLRVFERGVGETAACGTGACAAVVAAVRRNLSNRSVAVRVNGGALHVHWQEADDHVYLTGAVNRQFDGMLEI